jgi:hypothetical protein
MLKRVLSSVFSGRGHAPPVPLGAGQGSSVTVVTSFHASGFAQYGRAFLESFVSHWPDNYSLWVYAEDFDLEPPDSRIKVFDLHATIPSLHQFKRRHAIQPMASGQTARGYDYRFDAVRFANKSFVMCDAARRSSTRHLLWLDGDTRAFLDVPPDFLTRVLSDGDFMAYLGRTGYHTETGFLPFDLQHPAAKEFFSTLESIYETDTIFSLREWHDCEAIDVCRAVLSAQGRLRAKNLNVYGTSHPFNNSVVGLFMDHMKGPARKQAGQSHHGDYLIPPPARVNFNEGRYGQIPPLMKHLLPSEIIEVGTWSGWRGVQMSLPSLSAGKPVHYKGFDVFEQFTAEFDAREMNVKPHFALAEVERLLKLVSEIYPHFSFELIQGNTNETLKDEQAQFVFLDGGHSVETIQNDFDAVKRSEVILLDDYYAGGIDTTTYGCNRIIERLPHQVLPVKDPVSGGGSTQFALVSSLAIPQSVWGRA